MKKLLTFAAVSALFVATTVNGQVTLIGGSVNNGNLDRIYEQEIVPGFFLPKPAIWKNDGFRTLSGPYEDESSSEPWAGPAPTPVTADGLLNPAPFNQPDYGLFFKAFSGNTANGPATGHLYQDNPATPGYIYTLSGWAGAEANYLAARSVFAIDFFDAANNPLPGVELDLAVAGLFVGNGEPFNYKQYSLSAIAPAGTVNVRARVSMIDGMPNPAGGGQAFVVDDFRLIAVPEPSALALGLLGVLSLLAMRRRG